MRSAVILALLLSTFPAWATSVEKSSPSDSSAPAKASATLEFRIVIPETLQIDPSRQPRGRAQTFVTRNVTVENGCSIVTVAKP